MLFSILVHNLEFISISSIFIVSEKFVKQNLNNSIKSQTKVLTKTYK